MKGEWTTLKQESDAYLAIRTRFFATFGRGTTMPEGSNCALGGDFLFDAKLFEKNYRFDDNVFTIYVRFGLVES